VPHPDDVKRRSVMTTRPVQADAVQVRRRRRRGLVVVVTPSLRGTESPPNQSILAIHPFIHPPTP